MKSRNIKTRLAAFGLALLMGLSIICWDINLKDLKNNDEVIDIANQRRTLKIIQPEHEGDYTRYYLDSMRSGRKIEVFVLKYYLKEKLGIEFVPRTEKSTI